MARRRGDLMKSCHDTSPAFRRTPAETYRDKIVVFIDTYSIWQGFKIIVAQNKVAYRLEIIRHERNDATACEMWVDLPPESGSCEMKQ